MTAYCFFKVTLNFENGSNTFLKFGEALLTDKDPWGVVQNLPKMNSVIENGCLTCKKKLVYF